MDLTNSRQTSRLTLEQPNDWQARLTDKADARGQRCSRGTERMTTGLETYASDWQQNNWHNTSCWNDWRWRKRLADKRERERENHLHYIPMVKELFQGGSEYAEGRECGGGQQAIFIGVLQGPQHLRGETWSTRSWEYRFINIEYAVSTHIIECDVCACTC